MKNIFNEAGNILKNLFGINGDCWVIRKSTSSLNLDNCNGIAKSDEDTNTCEKCVALNLTIFKNNNKPNYNHPKCKCVNVECSEPNVKVELNIQKLSKYLFINTDKSAMMRSMGYYTKDINKLHSYIISLVKKQFLKNNYLLNKLNEYGQRIKIIYNLPGKLDHTGQIFECYVGCTVYPYGKLKISTPIVKNK